MQTFTYKRKCIAIWKNYWKKEYSKNISLFSAAIHKIKSAKELIFRINQKHFNPNSNKQAEEFIMNDGVIRSKT